MYDFEIVMIIAGIILYSAVTFIILISKGRPGMFDPTINYRKWTALNWFGVWVITALINIFYLPWSVVYWVIQIIYILFTYGRDK